MPINFIVCFVFINEVSQTFKISTNREEFIILCCKTETNTPFMYEVLDKDTIKTVILPHLSVAKRCCVTKSNLAEAIQCIRYKLKTDCQWHIMRKK